MRRYSVTTGGGHELQPGKESPTYCLGKKLFRYLLSEKRQQRRQIGKEVVAEVGAVELIVG